MNKIHKSLENNGFVLIKNYLSKEKNFLNFKKRLKNFLVNNLKVKKKNANLNKFITKSFRTNSNISAYINDNINLSPELQKMLVSDKILSLVSKVMKVSKSDLIFNNPRFRVQIPKNDKVSNLPWHQDSHYNKVKETKSIVVWISVSKITKQMGPIIFKVNSHKWGELRKKEIKKPNGGIAHTVNIKSQRLKSLNTKTFETEPGDIILIDMNCVHTSGKNNSINDIKYSAQARYHTIKRLKK